jgi:hypothetical protein|tara:strand:+ start:9497 stop:9772 length:276 start_codon:yes stop_codon:yes gene_type:complete
MYNKYYYLVYKLNINNSLWIVKVSKDINDLYEITNKHVSDNDNYIIYEKNINIYTLFKSGKSISYINKIYTKFKAFDKFITDNYSKQIFII